MTQRGAFIAGSSLAAAVVGALGLVAFFLWFGALRHLPAFANQLFILAMAPVITAACLSSAWVSGSKGFGRRGAWVNAVLTCLLAYPILFVVLWATIWTWLQFERYLPVYERPDRLLKMAETAAGYTLIAFVVGILPAICIEYFVVRFVRRRWSPALSAGVAP